MYLDNKKYKEAIKLFDQALDIREFYLNERHIDCASSLSNLTKVHIMMRNFKEALTYCKRVITILEDKLPPDAIEIKEMKDTREILIKVLEE